MNPLKIFMAGLAIFCVSPAVVQATLLPAAQTASDLTLTVGLLHGDGIEWMADPALGFSVQTETHTAALATTVQAMQERLGLPQTTVPAFSVHTATASASMSVDTLPDDGVFTRFTLRQSTSATTLTDEPFFARALSFAQGVSGWRLYQEQGATGVNPALGLTWNIEDWRLQASPIGSLAYIQNTVSVWQVTANHQLLRYDQVGLLSYQINGRESFAAFNLSGDAGAGNQWFAEIPLVFADNNPLELELIIVSDHVQMSYEAPPRAVIQVEAAAGRRATGGDSYPQVHWDSLSGTLKFDPIPIELLLGGGDAATTDFADDPLMGGVLEIGDFTYIGENNGQRYFSGSQLTLLDRWGQPALTAIAPTLALEDALYAHQGFNGFAPALWFEPRSALESAWLDAFFSRLSADSLYLPELFIGFDAARFTEGSFSAPVSALLSFAGPLPQSATPTPTPEPGVLWLLGVGGLLLMRWRQRVRLEANRQR